MPTNHEETLLIDLPSCNGIEGAKMFNTHPSSRQAVFDQNEDVLYIITTDRRNVKTNIRRLRFEDYPIPRPEDLYVSKEEFKETNDALKGAIDDVKFTLQQLLVAATEQTSSNGDNSAGNKSGGRRNGGNAKNNRGSNAPNSSVPNSQ